MATFGSDGYAERTVLRRFVLGALFILALVLVIALGRGLHGQHRAERPAISNPTTTTADPGWPRYQLPHSTLSFGHPSDWRNIQTLPSTNGPPPHQTVLAFAPDGSTTVYIDYGFSPKETPPKVTVLDYDPIIFLGQQAYMVYVLGQTPQGKPIVRAMILTNPHDLTSNPVAPDIKAPDGSSTRLSIEIICTGIDTKEALLQQPDFTTALQIVESLRD